MLRVVCASCFAIKDSMLICSFLFFKQKTAYEMRISDWSSDVCSSDLTPTRIQSRAARLSSLTQRAGRIAPRGPGSDRKSDVYGKKVSVRVDLGGRRNKKDKNERAVLNLIQTKSTIRDSVLCHGDSSNDKDIDNKERTASSNALT